VDENQVINHDILFGFNQNEATMFLYETFAGPGNYIGWTENIISNLIEYNMVDRTIYDNGKKIEIIEF
jgi:hypothetical protein